MFKRDLFSLLPTTFTPQVAAESEQRLISYLTSTHDPLVWLNAETTLEIYRIANLYIGDSFKDWLIANYGNGLGPRATLCKVILRWIKGGCTVNIVTGAIRRDLNRLDFLNGTDAKPEVLLSNTYIESNKEKQRIDFSQVENKDYYHLLASLGPELTAHFLLSLTGTRYRS